MSRGRGIRLCSISMRGLSSSLLAATVGAMLLLSSNVSLASEVTTSTDQHQFVVEGTTASELVRYMNRNAFEGDSGRAYANMHPDYQLSLTTEQAGGICRPSSINVNVALRLTLPVANTSAMGRITRALWTSFLAFARAHENHHKVTYLRCAHAFVHEALRQSAPSCTELHWDIEQMLAEMAPECEASEQPFERSQAKLLRSLPLFRAAQSTR